MTSTKEVGNGTVLGLFIADDVVVCKQFGKLRFANSSRGEGTTFITIQLPYETGKNDPQ